jgi:serine/threonine protein kinase
MVNQSNLLSQGGFGCVYYPGIDCKGSTIKNKKFVTKLQAKNSSSDNEISIGNQIKKIKNYYEFFLPVIESCPINANKISGNILTDCEPVQGKDDLLLMKMEYINSISFYKVLANEEKSSQSIIKSMIGSYLYLLKSLKMIGDKNIIHYDLKADNILFDKNTEIPLIIDFGISFNMTEIDFNKLYRFFYVYATDYYIWSFDIHIINFLVNEVDTDNYVMNKDVFKEITDSVVDNNKALGLFSKSFIEKYKKKCMIYGSKIIGKDKVSILKSLIQKECYQTWDNYSLSCIYLLFIQQAFQNKFPDSEFLIKLSQLLCVNISPDPADRFTIQETIDHVNNIVKNSQVSDLTSLANSLKINSKYIIQEHKKTEMKTIISV